MSVRNADTDDDHLQTLTRKKVMSKVEEKDLEEFIAEESAFFKGVRRIAEVLGVDIQTAEMMLKTQLATKLKTSASIERALRY